MLERGRGGIKGGEGGERGERGREKRGEGGERGREKALREKKRGTKGEVKKKKRERDYLNKIKTLKKIKNKIIKFLNIPSIDSGTIMGAVFS